MKNSMKIHRMWAVNKAKREEGVGGRGVLGGRKAKQCIFFLIFRLQKTHTQKQK